MCDVPDDIDIAYIIETTDIDRVIDVTKASDVKIVVVDVPNVLNVTYITSMMICVTFHQLLTSLRLQLQEKR
jgi:hypothetical protein